MKPLHVLGLFVLMVATSVTTVVVWTWIADKGNRQEVRVQREEAVLPSGPKAEPEPAKIVETAKTASEPKTAELPKAKETKLLDEAASIKPLTGKLVVKLTRNKVTEPDCRVYVDGRIVAIAAGSGWPPKVSYEGQERFLTTPSGRVLKFPEGTVLPFPYEPLSQDFDLLLIPGEYKVDVATRVDWVDPFHPSSPSSWQVRWGAYHFDTRTVTLAAGQVATLEFGAQYSVCDFMSFGREVDGVHIDRVGKESFNALAKLVANTVERYQADPVVKAMSEVRFALLGTSPARRSVLINMPEELGGRREYDGAQVRHLVRWLKLRHWGWIMNCTPRPELNPVDGNPFATEAQKARIRQDNVEITTKLSQLADQISRYCRAVDDLNEIATKLEQTKK